MSSADLHSLLPELILCGGGILILLVDAFVPAARRLLTPLALVSVIAAGWGSAQLVLGGSFGGQLQASTVTFGFGLVVLVATFLSLLASEGYLRREHLHSGEYHALMLWCAAGLYLLLRSTELLTLFVALELLSLCLYALAAFHRRIALSTEAAIKYFLMGAFVSAFVLLGIALLYGETQTTELEEIGRLLRLGIAARPVAVLGILLLIAGFGFKMSIVPFHAWSPDAYQGAPSPFVAFLSVAPKAASAVVLMRLLAIMSPSVLNVDWSAVIAVLAVASMVVGNLLALVQREIKRMLAYSGIAHMGYLLVALVSLNEGSFVAVLVYMLAYALMNAGAFAVISLLYPRPGEQHLVSEISGFGYRHPLLGACLTVSMLSLAGIPPTFGFFGKYLVFLHAVETGHVWLAITGVIASFIGVFYYLRVVYTLYMKADRAEVPPVAVDAWGQTAAVLATAGSILFGVIPGRLMEWIF